VIQAGMVGLVQAAGRFDPQRGAQFSSYAVPFILGEMRDCVRHAHGGHVGRKAREQAAGLLAVQEKMTMDLGRKPTLRELAAQSGLSSEETAAALSALLPVQSIEAQMEDQPDRLSDGCRMEEESINSMMTAQAMKQLDGQLRTVIKLRFFYDQTQKQVGEAIGLSQVQVSRLEKRALQTLRTMLTENPSGYDA